MIYFFIGGAALLAALAAYQGLSRVSPRQRMRWLRWGAGGGLSLLALVLLVARRIDIAVFVGAAAFSVLRTGRLGPFSFESKQLDGDTVSKVRSRYFEMELDHSSGTVRGQVRAGQFVGRDLIELGEMETRALIAEVDWDPDSVSLLESWLDANRAGWREYFAGGETAAENGPSSSSDPVAEAYAVLGLNPGASPEEIRAAHRELMKGVHPDHGGSSYLASKINEARDLLLKRAK